MRRDGKEIAQLGSGDIVGEAAIVGHTLRTASIVALTPLVAIHFTDTDINALLEEMPSLPREAGGRRGVPRQGLIQLTDSRATTRSTSSTPTSSARRRA